MLEITRELVEHYLRATGWAMAFGSPYVYSHPNVRHELVLFGDYPKAWLPAIAEALSQDRSVVAFRLGLCAAAESLLEEARVVNKSIAKGGPVVDEYDERVGSMRFVVSHITTADSILALAGISADAWESARKR